MYIHAQELSVSLFTADKLNLDAQFVNHNQLHLLYSTLDILWQIVRYSISLLSLVLLRKVY